MAIKYCDPSATYNGDGTASTGAASAGAVGAWNNFQDVLEGTPTYGSVAAGDEIIFRTYNGGNITVNWTKNLVMTAAGTAVSPIIFRFDDGTVWANGGSLILSSGTSNYTISFPSEIQVIADYDHATLFYGWVLENNSSSNNGTFFKVKGGYFCGVELRCNNATQKAIAPNVTHAIRTVFEHCYINTSIGNSNGRVSDYFTYKSIVYVFRDCYFNMNGMSTTPSNGYGIFRFQAPGGRVEVRGGGLLNTLPNQIVFSTFNSELSGNGACFFIDDFDVGNADFAYPAAAHGYGNVFVYAIAKDYNQALYLIGSGCIDWKKAQNYPTLNALLPDGVTPWCWRCLPATNCGMTNPLVLTKLYKYFTAMAATKTLTVELCIKDTSAGSGAYDTVSKSMIWMEVCYVDNSTGEFKFQSSERTGSLDTSAVTWVPEISGHPVYAANNYDKYKLSVTTATAVKQNTLIEVEVFFALPAIYTDDYFFVDPDVSIT